MTYLLTELLETDLDTSPLTGVSVSGVSATLGAVRGDCAYFSWDDGAKDAGGSFSDAITKGAIAIISDRPSKVELSVPLIVLPDVRAAYARAVAQTFEHQPEFCVAVTGSSGTQVIASFVRQVLAAVSIPAAAISGAGVEMNDELIPGNMLDADPRTLHEVLSKIAVNGTSHVVLAASSKGLEQRRLDGISFSVVGFANLGDTVPSYHADMDAYRDAKLRLFKELLIDQGMAVVNSDDEEHMPFMFAALDRGATLLTVGTEGAYFEISSVVAEGSGQRVVGKLVGETVEFLLPFSERAQVDYAVMAASLAIQAGADQHLTIEALNSLKFVS